MVSGDYSCVDIADSRLVDLLIGLYFQNFQRTYPFVHVPTFTPRVTPAPLCLAFLALGAIHCPLPGSLQLGRVLLEVARRIIESLLTKDNRLARSLPIMQTLVSSQMRGRGSGFSSDPCTALPAFVVIRAVVGLS